MLVSFCDREDCHDAVTDDPVDDWKGEGNIVPFEVYSHGGDEYAVSDNCQDPGEWRFSCLFFPETLNGWPEGDQ